MGGRLVVLIAGCTMMFHQPFSGLLIRSSDIYLARPVSSEADAGQVRLQGFLLFYFNCRLWQ